MNGHVYAIADGWGHVKIGWSADPVARLLNMQVGTAASLMLLGMISATTDHEREIQQLLQRWHVRGEWFKLEGAVLAFVEMLPKPRVFIETPTVAAQALKKAIVLAGGASALARSLGISGPAVMQWTEVPIARALAVGRLTGVPIHELRPDLYSEEDTRRLMKPINNFT